MRRYKILMTSAHSKLMDGVNRHILALASALNGRPEVDVLVCTALREGALNQALTEQGVRNVALRLSSIRSVLGPLVFLRLLWKFKPDIVHFELPALFYNLSVFVANLFGAKIKCVGTVHGVGSGSASPGSAFSVSYGRIRAKLLMYFQRRMDGLIFVSRGVYEEYQRTNAIEDVIYNPVRFDPNVQLGQRDPIIVGTACRLTAIKQPEAFSAVMANVLRRLPYVRAQIVGDGDPWIVESLRLLAAEKDLRGRFEVLGYRPNAAEIISNFSCFIMTSKCEGMPTALLEAMSKNVPIAFWRGRGGLMDLDELNRETSQIAIVRDQGDVEGLSNGIVELLQNMQSAGEMAARAFNVGAERFSIQRAADLTIDHYKRVLA